MKKEKERHWKERLILELDEREREYLDWFIQQEIDRVREEERERIRKDFNDIFRAGVSMRVNWQKIEENHYSFKGYLIREEVIGKLLSEFISKLKKEEE